MANQTNKAIADKLREMADVLEQQDADGYRIAAYRRAARTLDDLETPVEQIAREKGLAGIVDLPTIGRGIGTAIMEMLTTGRWAQLDRLTGMLDTEHLFQTLPGIGPDLAKRLHDALQVDTLEALESAAHDGRLEAVPGIGARRAKAIRSALSDRLGHQRVRRLSSAHLPPVDVLLDVDREYREKASAGLLRKIAPKRFNSKGEAWLPVFHARRGDWEFTALYSNTQKAHELDKIGDWVVIYVHREGEPEAQATVVTETRGPLEGRRVVRGHEGDCIAHYAASEHA